MGLISVDRKPVIEGSGRALVTVTATLGAGVFAGYSSGSLYDVTGTQLPANLRFYSVTVDNLSGIPLYVAFSSVFAVIPFDYIQTIIVDGQQSRTFDVSTLLGVTGVRTIQLAASGPMSRPIGSVPTDTLVGYNASAIAALSAQFYTPQQSA